MKILMIVILAIALAFNSCKKTTLTPQLFVTIQNEILASDMQQSTKEAIVAKYGVTLKEYEEYEKKVENDPELKALVGKERLQRFVK